MNSARESSKRSSFTRANACAQTLASVYHPHGIEVQEFSFYGLILDVRDVAAFTEDHLPGAVNIEIATVWDALPALLAGLSPGAAILIYCGSGGELSEPIAKVLRIRGWRVDVLAGGWINYRRWVQDGLEVLPRLLTLRLGEVAGEVAGEAAGEVAGADASASQSPRVTKRRLTQALCLTDVATLAAASSASQAWFESQLLCALRRLNPRQPVIVTGLESARFDSRTGDLALPPALLEAIGA
jgi:tRNA 2-selenouridine synthase